MDVNDESVFTPEERSEIRRMIKQQSEINPVTLETRDQLPLGLMSYGFQATELHTYGNFSNPTTYSFEVKHGRNVYLWLSGSGYRGTSGIIGVDAFVDGVAVASSVTFTNETNSHKAFVPTFRKINVSRGPRSLTLSLRPDTAIDNNDFFECSVFELP